jgi:hypothetical protein|nr:MAG TPA: hypothetical protein [Caudoviricetes sp.]
MATIQTKKFSELTELMTCADSSMLLIHDGTGVKKISAKNLKKDVSDLITKAQNVINQLTFDGAGAHNAVFRGKSLGTSVTAEQYAAIANGKFTDMYIGDYWTISSVNWRIAAFDYYYRTGDTECTTHHVTLVPDTSLYNAQMHKTESGQYEAGAANTTEGAYVNSDMYKTGLADAKSKIETAFGAAHILEHRQYLANTTANGRQSAGSWYNSTVELMTENNVYGGNIFHPVSDGTVVPTNYTIDKSQYPLFAMRPDMISNRITYWLRDVVSAAYFAFVSYYGRAFYGAASYSYGVRPAFSIKS